LLILLACSIVAITLNAPTFATAKGVIELADPSNSEDQTQPFPEIPDYDFKYLYRDTAYEKIARQDLSVMYGYLPYNTSAPVIYVSIGVSSSLSNLHNWEVCLITYQTAQGQAPLVEVLDSKDIQLLQHTPLIARFLVLNQEPYTQVTLYWYEKVAFKSEFTVEQKYIRINLIMLTQNPQLYPIFQEELLTVAKLSQKIGNQ
jgi:hypothetical protein